MHFGFSLSSYFSPTFSLRERGNEKWKRKSNDKEPEMLNWLDELNFQHQVEQICFCRTEIREISPNRLRAIVFGEARNEDQHVVLTEIKSVTFHQLQVEQTSDGFWTAQVIFDI